MVKEKIWSFKDVDTRLIMSLVNELKISSTLALLLVNRGYDDPKKANEFLNPCLENLSSPFKMQAVGLAVKTIVEALKNKRKIVIYGDYDVDGITATALLVAVLQDLGGQVDYYIPDRVEEGYGLSFQALEKIVPEKPLVITVDCGISSVEEVISGQAFGLDFIVTDHHQPPEILPPCLIINPLLEKGSTPFAGVGVAFKLAQALLESSLGSERGKSEAYQYLDLVALGTIADIVPLVGENRVLVKYGLEKMSKGKRLGIKALAEAASVDLQKITSEQVSFFLAPRLNACGRIGHAGLGVKLLLSQKEEVAKEIAQNLNKANQERQSIEARIMEEALLLTEKIDLNENPVIVLAGDHWHPGVIGIVASRLVEKYYRPTILLTKQDGLYKGSGRSIPGFHLYQALQQCQEYLHSFGGHSQAAGLSLREENLFRFCEKINFIARKILQKENLIPSLALDGEIDLADVDFNFLEELRKLEPFGAANPEPVLVYRNGEVHNYRQVGSNGEHLKLTIKAHDTYWDAIGFNMAGYSEIAASREPLDFAFTLDENKWNGTTSLQLILKDIKPNNKIDNPYCPPNLLESFPKDSIQIIDYRGCNDKIGYIKNLLRAGEFTTIYVNSQKEAKYLVRELEADPELKDKILFNKGDFSKEEYEKIGKLIAKGFYRVIIGGINYSEILTPHLKHLVLYNLCFSKAEYEKLLQKTCTCNCSVKVHFLYGIKDKAKNLYLLRRLAPGRKQLVLFYLLLKKIANKDLQITLNDKEIVSLAKSHRILLSVSDVCHWLKILEELKLLEVEIKDSMRVIILAPNPAKVKLEQSPLFLEGVRKRLDFQEYQKIAFGVLTKK